MPNFARTAAPLIKRIATGQSFESELSVPELDAFYKLKEKLFSPPILAFPRQGYKYTLDTDAFKYQVGCTLLHDQSKRNRLPVSYWKLSSSESENNYNTTEKKYFAIVFGV